MVRLIKWADAAAREVWAFLKFAGHLARPSSHPAVQVSGLLSLAILIGLLAYISRATVHYAYIPPGESVLQQAELHLLTAVRAEPDAFKPNMRLPHRSEIRSSGAIHLKAFFPEYDLMHVDDPRVWWESDHDTDDVEDDHLVHYAMEIPLKRLIELVHREGGKLKVQDAYRADGIHYPKSLHKEGRAIDLTCENMTLEKLAKLCWAADFDWVFYEAPKGGGHHIHASVRADR
ncbi:MAG TPA: hypothetical protein PKM67_03310 [Kiritimatiellia bacterium]|nr:hypothetical protein [Kiritimatiellia bacterium]HNS80465.1 hypothetical protein [Kiritimatiellia bacterium]HPA77290.1 hypothetical protein [Kiritimatiellia bacterium]HQQ03222.1 hypothetical protein [Kiritimatiellia bacterium]